MGSAPEVTPSPDPQGWSTQSTGYEKDVPQRERKSLHLGQGHTFLGEIPSERNNSSEKENNRLFSGQAEREPGVFPAPWALQAQQTPTQAWGYFAVRVPKQRTQTGKQHKAQEEEEVYGCPQKSQHGLSSQSFHIPWEKHNNSSASLHSALWELEPRA